MGDYEHLWWEFFKGESFALLSEGLRSWHFTLSKENHLWGVKMTWYGFAFTERLTIGTVSQPLSSDITRKINLFYIQNEPFRTRIQIICLLSNRIRQNKQSIPFCFLPFWAIYNSYWKAKRAFHMEIFSNLIKWQIKLLQNHHICFSVTLENKKLCEDI